MVKSRWQTINNIYIEERHFRRQGVAEVCLDTLPRTQDFCCDPQTQACQGRQWFSLITSLSLIFLRTRDQLRAPSDTLLSLPSPPRQVFSAPRNQYCILQNYTRQWNSVFSWMLQCQLTFNFPRIQTQWAQSAFNYSPHSVFEWVVVVVEWKQ